jgi:hypothetical protein
MPKRRLSTGGVSYVLELALDEARVETLRRRARACLSYACLDASALGRAAELEFAARAGFAVWSCLPRWVRAAIHGDARAVTTRDRGVDVVGLRDGRLILAQIKWYHHGACVCGDAGMKLALIASEAQRAMQLDEPPRAILVMRRGSRTTRTSPGTTGIEYVELSDDEIGMSARGGLVGLSGARGLSGLNGVSGLTRAGPVAVCHAGPFEHFRYVPKARDVQKRRSEISEVS